MLLPSSYRVRVDECLLHVLAVLVPHDALKHAHVGEGQFPNEEVAVAKLLVLFASHDGLVVGADPEGLLVVVSKVVSGAANEVRLGAQHLHVGAHPLVDSGSRTTPLGQLAGKAARTGLVA
jgi:hypothetical protein